MLLVALIVFGAISIASSSSEVASRLPFSSIAQVLMNHFHLGRERVLPQIDALVWFNRVPRVLAAGAVGAALALAGVAFQSLLRNPLADPYLIGASAGSALGSSIIIVLGYAGALAGFAQPLAAFATGLLTVFVVTSLSLRQGRISTSAFLLSGVVLGTFLWSLIPLMLSLTKNDQRQGHIISQLLGNLEGVGWEKLDALAIFGITGGIALWLANSELNLMALGEESAARLGVNTEAFKIRVIVTGALLTSISVAVAGMIAFVGLIVPHLTRRITGPDHRWLLPGSAIMGALLLVVSDWVSRVFLNGIEVGVVTSITGAVLFCSILRKQG